MYISQWWASPIFIKNPLCTGYRYTILDRFEPGSLHWLYPTLDVDFQRRASPQLENSSEFFRLDTYKTFKIHSQLFDIFLRWLLLNQNFGFLSHLKTFGSEVTTISFLSEDSFLSNRCDKHASLV
jgi:hypothetical protein